MVQILQFFFNIVQNASDPTPPTLKSWIATSEKVVQVVQIGGRGGGGQFGQDPKESIFSREKVPKDDPDHLH